MLNELLNYYFLKIIIKTENFYRQKLFLIINLIKNKNDFHININ